MNISQHISLFFFDILDSSIFIVGQSMMNIFTEYENKKQQISEGL